MPESHHLVVFAVDDERGAIDVRNLFQVVELIEGKELDLGDHAKSADERALQDDPPDRMLGGQFHTRSRPERATVQYDGGGIDSAFIDQITVGCDDSLITTVFGRRSLTQAVARIIIGKYAQVELAQFLQILLLLIRQY